MNSDDPRKHWRLNLAREIEGFSTGAAVRLDQRFASLEERIAVQAEQIKLLEEALKTLAAIVALRSGRPS